MFAKKCELENFLIVKALSRKVIDCNEVSLATAGVFGCCALMVEKYSEVDIVTLVSVQVHVCVIKFLLWGIWGMVLGITQAGMYVTIVLHVTFYFDL